MITPKIRIIRPETLAQKDGSSPISKLLNLINKLKMNTEKPKEAYTISALLLGFLVCFKLPPIITGNIGKAQGAKTVNTPEIKLSSRMNITSIDQ